MKSKTLKRLGFVLLGLMLTLFIYALLQLIDPVKIPATSTKPLQFQGKALLVASDADMVGTAYADAKLDRVQGIEDTLTSIKLPLDDQSVAKTAIGQVQVSNSVMSWPQIIAVSPNGQRAYVVEVRGRPDDGIQELKTIDEMPSGSKLAVVDIANVTQPKIVETIDIGHNPEHVSISPNGKYLMVNLEDPGKELMIAGLNDNGTLGSRSYFPMKTNGTRRDNRTAIWHPSGKYIAMTQDENSRIGFYKVDIVGEQVQVTPYSEPVNVGNHLGHPSFTNDGRFVVVPDLKWSTQAMRTANFLLNPPGTVTAIKFEPETNQPPEITSQVDVGLSPEGLALSPDNQLVVTVNMRRTYLPNYIPAWRGRDRNSLSLVQFNPNSGQLKTVDEYGFGGLLPEQVTFDTTGKGLAVVVFNDRIAQPKTGRVEFWNVVTEAQPKLEPTGTKIDVVRGAHDIVLVP